MWTRSPAPSDERPAIPPRHRSRTNDLDSNAASGRRFFTGRSVMANPLLAPVLGYLSRLKYPQLFKLAALLFAIDFVVPDVVPFIDEILLGLTTLLLGNWKQRRGEKDVTPRP